MAGTKDIVQVHLTWRCALTGTFQQGKERRKLLATDIAWVGFSVHTDSLQQKLWTRSKGMGKTHINKKHLQMAFAMVTIHADTETLWIITVELQPLQFILFCANSSAKSSHMETIRLRASISSPRQCQPHIGVPRVCPLVNHFRDGMAGTDVMNIVLYDSEKYNKIANKE